MLRPHIMKISTCNFTRLRPTDPPEGSKARSHLFPATIVEKQVKNDKSWQPLAQCWPTTVKMKATTSLVVPIQLLHVPRDR
jgi:hypothetical protein